MIITIATPTGMPVTLNINVNTRFFAGIEAPLVMISGRTQMGHDVVVTLETLEVSQILKLAKTLRRPDEP